MTQIKTAIVFPGQGSQSVGMISDIAAQYPEVSETFAEAQDALQFDLWNLVVNGPVEKLDLTMYTQPALLAASYAVYKILIKHGNIQPAVFAGHSLGEYTALVASGALQFADAIKLVSARGRFMQEAVKPNAGAMAAIIGLDDAAVVAMCDEIAKETKSIISPANYNSIAQVVVAGDKFAIDVALFKAKTLGAKMAVLIPVSVPSHCKLMEAAAYKLNEMLATINFSSLQTPVINNVDVNNYSDALSIRDGLTRQLYMPVRWVETVKSIAALGVKDVIECGPGKVLTGLNKRISKALKLYSTSDLASLTELMHPVNERSA